jgi:RNA polymerase sigma-70 factor (ECF subfamily)
MLNFKDLYETYAPDVFRFSLWLAGDPTNAEDITSETFVRAWARRSTVRTETLKAYLFTIARNIFLQRRSRDSRHVLLDDIYPDPSPGPDQLLESRLALHDIHSFLQTLSEIDRSAFVLRVQYELPYAEIARILQLSLSAAKVKVHRVRKKLIANYTDKELP